jgi:urease accessory protein
MDVLTLLLLTDSRLPAGTHAHSGGLEAAVAAGGVRDAATLHAFLLGRLTSVGLTSAAFAAATVAGREDPAELDDEYDARTPSPAQRRASRRLGRQLLRAARAGWPHSGLDKALGVHPDGPHQPIAFGAAAAAAGLDPPTTAQAAALGAVTGAANAATRLLGLDPDAVTTVLASLVPTVREVASAAAQAACGPAADLPASSALLLDISAEHHATWEVRLFAS